MRLRSSQLVLLLLLACSMQVQQESALRWIASSVTEAKHLAAQPSATATNAQLLPAPPLTPQFTLEPADLAASTAAWPVAHPAAASAAVASHTSLRRA